MQIVQGSFTDLGTEQFQLFGWIELNEFCILDRQTNKFYARSYKYTSFGKCEIMDRFLEWVGFDPKTKTLIIKKVI